MVDIVTAPETPVEKRHDLVANLGVSAPKTDAVTWDGLAGELGDGAGPAFTSIGEAIREDLAGRLDGATLERERENLEAEIARLPDVREAGIPDEIGDLYGEVAEPGWRVYDHFLEVGLFESLDENLPRFSPSHIEDTARELILTESLSSALTDVGFDEREKTWLLTSVVNERERLSRWVPANAIPDGVEFDVENVPPLHQRAMGGTLLWIRGLDRHLVQYEPLITADILDDAVGYVKALLGGLYVVTTAAHELATDGGLTDGQLTAAFTAGAAIQITGQEDLMRDVFYITDEMRAPSELR